MIERLLAGPKLRRWAFGVYALILFAATHWPRLALPLGPIPRPDLLQHLVAFGLWSVLFTACGFFGRWNSRRNIGLSLLCGCVYACVDEGLQAIPWIRRVFGWEDMAFNIIGILCGALCILALSKALSGRATCDRNTTTETPRTQS